jgi:hypothetical protein
VPIHFEMRDLSSWSHPSHFVHHSCQIDRQTPTRAGCRQLFIPTKLSTIIIKNSSPTGQYGCLLEKVSES